MDRMKQAEQAVNDAAVNIPANIRYRFDTAEKFSDEDQQAILKIAQQSLKIF